MLAYLVPFFMLLLWICGAKSSLVVKQSVQGADGRQGLHFNVTLESSLLPANSLYNITLTSKVTGFMVDQSSFATGPEGWEKSSYEALSDDGVLWHYPQLTAEETAYLSFKAKPHFSIPEGKSFYNASLMYQVEPPINGTNVSVPYISSFCLETVNTLSTELSFNHGLIAVAVVFGFLGGVVIVLLLLLGIFYATKRNPFSCVEKKDNSSAKFSPKSKASGKTSEGPARRYDGIPKRKFPPWTDSIISILRIPDQNDIIREIERLDIEDTMRMCHDLDLQRDEAGLNLAMNLVHSLVTNGAISKKTESSCTMSMLKRLESVKRRMDDKLQQQTEDAETGGMVENEKKLEALAQKHEEELNHLMESLKEVDPQEVRSVRKLLKEKHHLERSQLQCCNELKKQEEIEKLFLESCLNKRVARRELLQAYLRDVSTATASPTLEHLAKEFDQLEVTVAEIFAEAESNRLRAVEEKCAKRKCLVKTQELAQSHGRVLLNTVTEQLIQLVAFAQKSGKLSQSNARRVTEDIIAEAEEFRRSGEEEKEQNTLELLTKLNDTKKNQLYDQMKLFEQKLNEIKKKHNSAEVKDSLLLLEVVQTNITRHEEEMAEREIQIDSDDANDLLKLQELLQEQLKQNLLRSKDNLIKDLREIGVQSTKMRPWLERHELELQELQQIHEKKAKEQHNNLKKQLSAGVVRLSGILQHKYQHQEQLKTYKQAVVRNLLNSQMALRSGEREQVEADLAGKRNNSATSTRALDKLKYRRMMEDKQVKQKADGIEMLKKKLEQELKKLQLFESKKSKGLEDDVEDKRPSMLLALFKNYYKRCLAVLNGEEIVTDDDDEVSIELNRDQARVLKEEEENLAVRLVKIQIKKTKEFLKPETERSILRRVTCDLVRKLTEDNVLSVADCQRLLQTYAKDLKSGTISPRDDMKIRNLTESRRKLLDESSESVGEEYRITNSVKSPTSIKLRKILLLEKQITEQCAVRNQTEREIRQEVEELKRSDGLDQVQLTLVKELELLANILKGGRYSREDVENIFQKHFQPTSSVDWRSFLHQYQISDETIPASEKTDANNRLRNKEETSQQSTRADKSSTTPERSLLKISKLHPQSSSVSPIIAYDELDNGASSSQAQSYLYRKPNYDNPRLTQTTPSLRLPPITPAVGSKQKKSVRLVETHNEYWSN